MNVSIATADQYMADRTGKYEWRAVRYRAALRAMQDRGLSDHHTVYDIGAGWTELDFLLRAEGQWRGRYIPVDMGIDGTNLEIWTPPRRAEFAVALELLEHLHSPHLMLDRLMQQVDHIIVSVPNPLTVDVLGIDPTHVTPVAASGLRTMGFHVQEAMFYGGAFSGGEPDSLFATWDRGEG